MRVMVFVTDDGTDNGTGPLLYLPERPDAALPDHPRSLEWRYFATVGEDDNLVVSEAPGIWQSIKSRGYHIASRLV